MALATIFQSLGIANKKLATPASKNDDMRKEQLDKATALYNFEIQVAHAINYMTPELLRGRLDHMRENNATYSQSIASEIKQQNKKILELETSFTSINLTADEQKEAEELFTKIDAEKKRLKALEMELQASKAFYINNDLIRARILDMKTGSTYEEIVSNEKESWLEIHQVFNSKSFFPVLL